MGDLEQVFYKEVIFFLDLLDWKVHPHPPTHGTGNISDYFIFPDIRISRGKKAQVLKN